MIAAAEGRLDALPSPVTASLPRRFAPAAQHALRRRRPRGGVAGALGLRPRRRRPGQRQDALRRASAAPATRWRAPARRAPRARTSTTPSPAPPRRDEREDDRGRRQAPDRAIRAAAASCPPSSSRASDADDVAAYVGYAAGKPGKDQGPLAAAGRRRASDKPVVAKGGKLHDRRRSTAPAFQYTKATAPAGQVTLDMPNKSPLAHNIAIKGGGVNEHGQDGPAGRHLDRSRSPEARQVHLLLRGARPRSRPA